MRTVVKTWLKLIVVGGLTACIAACGARPPESSADAATAASAAYPAAGAPDASSPASTDPMTQIPASKAGPAGSSDSSLQ
jgi:hypothetical protein